MRWFIVIWILFANFPTTYPKCSVQFIMSLMSESLVRNFFYALWSANFRFEGLSLYHRDGLLYFTYFLLKTSQKYVGIECFIIMIKNPLELRSAMRILYFMNVLRTSQKYILRHGFLLNLKSLRYTVCNANLDISWIFGLKGFLSNFLLRYNKM